MFGCDSYLENDTERYIFPTRVATNKMPYFEKVLLTLECVLCTGVTGFYLSRLCRLLSLKIQLPWRVKIRQTDLRVIKGPEGKVGCSKAGNLTVA